MAAPPAPRRPAAPPGTEPASRSRPLRSALTVRDLVDDDSGWLTERLDERWGGRFQARRGEVIDVAAMEGLVAVRLGRPVGVLLYERSGRETELALLDAFDEATGVGTALLEALRPLVAGCSRVWLVTTNDNLRALRFYQRRGWRLFVLRPGAVDLARRRRKPAIPTVGLDGIAVRDELELEWVDR